MTARTVLVVDDDEDIRYLTQMALESVAGWLVHTAASGAEAVEVARRQQPDAMLLDLMMPAMDGLTTMEHLNADQATRAIPVILFTAKSVVGGRQPWEDSGCAGVIAKPFDPMTLADRISAILAW